MNRHHGALLCLVVELSSGCVEESRAAPADGMESGANSSASSEGGVHGTGNEHPTFVVMIDPAFVCREAIAVELVATQIGCVAVGPCTLPNPRPSYRGEALSCEGAPEEIGETELIVSVDRKGLYHVELVAMKEDGTEARLCYGLDASTRTAVEQADLETRPSIVLEALGKPCE